MRPNTRLLTLAAVNGIAALAVVWAYTRTWDTSPIAPDREPALLLGDPSQELLTRDADGVGNYEVANAYTRPLFSRNRRPWRPPEAPIKQSEPVAAVKAPPPNLAVKPNFDLIGVSIAGNSSSALLHRPGTAETTWVNLGAQAWDWTVVAISDQKIVVEQAGLQAEISLYPASPAAVR